MIGLRCLGENVVFASLPSEKAAELVQQIGFFYTETISEETALDTAHFHETGGQYRLSGLGFPSTDYLDPDLLLQVLRPRLIKRIAKAKPDLLFLQGDAVRTKEGQAILLAGPSISGKTTLAQALVERDADWWSRDVLVINGRGEILPFPATEDQEDGLTASTVALITYRPEAELSLEELSPGQAVLQLAPLQLFQAESKDPSGAFARLGQVASDAKVRKTGVHGSVRCHPALLNTLTQIG